MYVMSHIIMSIIIIILNIAYHLLCLVYILLRNV